MSFQANHRRTHFAPSAGSSPAVRVWSEDEVPHVMSTLRPFSAAPATAAGNASSMSAAAATSTVAQARARERLLEIRRMWRAHLAATPAALRQPGYLEGLETRGFASPPHDGFALVGISGRGVYRGGPPNASTALRALDACLTPPPGQRGHRRSPRRRPARGLPLPGGGANGCRRGR